MKQRRLGPKHADRRKRKASKARRRTSGGWRLNKLLLEKTIHRCHKRKPPAEQVILLRLINILGLLLLVMSVAILSGNENLKEIIELGRKLFILLP